MISNWVVIRFYLHLANAIYIYILLRRIKRMFSSTSFSFCGQHTNWLFISILLSVIWIVVLLRRVFYWAIHHSHQTWKHHIDVFQMVLNNIIISVSFLQLFALYFIFFYSNDFLSLILQQGAHKTIGVNKKSRSNCCRCIDNVFVNIALFLSSIA